MHRKNFHVCYRPAMQQRESFIVRPAATLGMRPLGSIATIAHQYRLYGIQLFLNIAPEGDALIGQSMMSDDAEDPLVPAESVFTMMVALKNYEPPRKPERLEFVVTGPVDAVINRIDQIKEAIEEVLETSELSN